MLSISFQEALMQLRIAQLYSKTLSYWKRTGHNVLQWVEHIPWKIYSSFVLSKLPACIDVRTLWTNSLMYILH